MNKTSLPYSISQPLHPTVAAEFVIKRAGEVGAGCASLGECEKAALAHLRSLPARP